MNLRFCILLLTIAVAGSLVGGCSARRAAVESPAPGARTPTAASDEISSTAGEAVVVQSTIASTTGTVAGPEASARAFVGEPDLVLSGGDLLPGALSPTQVYTGTLATGDRVRFKVDVRTGEVMGFNRYDQPNRHVKVSAEQAEAAALTFAREHYESFDSGGLRLVNRGLVDHGPDSVRFYGYDWVQIDPVSEAYLPNEIRIRVNPETGQVDSYSARRTEVTVPTQPQIPRAEAERLALEATKDLQGHRVVDGILFVSSVPLYEPNGRQALLWAVQVEGESTADGYVPGAVVYIDALSGETLLVDPNL